MLRATQRILPFVHPQIELKFGKLILSRQVIIFIIIKVRFSLMFNFVFELIQKIHRFLSFIVFDFPGRSKLKQ